MHANKSIFQVSYVLAKEAMVKLYRPGMQYSKDCDPCGPLNPPPPPCPPCPPPTKPPCGGGLCSCPPCPPSPPRPKPDGLCRKPPPPVQPKFGLCAPPAGEDMSAKKYEYIFYFICIPAIILQALRVFGGDHEDHDLENCRDYEFMRIRTKRFPWGDGNKTFFHNDRVNKLPGECERPPDEDECAPKK